MVLNAIVAAGGRLELGTDSGAGELARIAGYLTRERLVPDGQQVAQEPTRMDPDLGITVYLQPDFAA